MKLPFSARWCDPNGGGIWIIGQIEGIGHQSYAMFLNSYVIPPPKRCFKRDNCFNLGMILGVKTTTTPATKFRGNIYFSRANKIEGQHLTKKNMGDWGGVGGGGGVNE